jgi:hypothetical protein
MLDWCRKNCWNGDHDRRPWPREDLEKAGFSRDQADLRELELRLDARFAQIERKIAETQIGLIKRFTGIMVAQGAAIVALIKLLP